MYCTVLGGEYGTVVGISEWSPASGARVGGCLQSECVSERQGMLVLTYAHALHGILYYTLCRTDCTSICILTHIERNTR